MTTREKTGLPSWLSGRVRVLALVAVAAAVAVLVATALAASGGDRNTQRRAVKRTGIAVFLHHPKDRARIAQDGSATTPPSGAILAEVVGRTAVYAFQNASGRDCLIHITTGAGGGSVCGRRSTVEEKGIVGIGGEGEGATAPGSPATLRVTALLPNGVASVTFTDRDGSTHQVSVTNNVVEREDINIASIGYTMPNGERLTTNVAAVVDGQPKQPGPPGSSK